MAAKKQRMQAADGDKKRAGAFIGMRSDLMFMVLAVIPRIFLLRIRSTVT